MFFSMVLPVSCENTLGRVDRDSHKNTPVLSPILTTPCAGHGRMHLFRGPEAAHLMVECTQ